jgi:hypothetical protein
MVNIIYQSISQKLHTIFLTNNLYPMAGYEHVEKYVSLTVYLDSTYVGAAG